MWRFLVRTAAQDQIPVGIERRLKDRLRPIPRLRTRGPVTRHSATGQACLIWLLAALTLLVTTACGAERDLQLLIYDPTGHTDTRLDASDVVRSTARAVRTPDGSWALSFELTDTGAAKFQKLTRQLAQRGADLRAQQAFAVKIDDRVYARPTVDYRVFPAGLDGSSRLEITGLKRDVALRLAERIVET